jgi:hypothetical protein
VYAELARRNLRYPQTCPIGRSQRCLVFGTKRRLKKPRHLLGAENALDVALWAEPEPGAFVAIELVKKIMFLNKCLFGQIHHSRSQPRIDAPIVEAPCSWTGTTTPRFTPRSEIRLVRMWDVRILVVMESERIFGAGDFRPFQAIAQINYGRSPGRRVPVRRDRYFIPNVETTHDRPWVARDRHRHARRALQFRAKARNA